MVPRPAVDMGAAPGQRQDPHGNGIRIKGQGVGVLTPELGHISRFFSPVPKNLGFFWEKFKKS